MHNNYFGRQTPWSLWVSSNSRYSMFYELWMFSLELVTIWDWISLWPIWVSYTGCALPASCALLAFLLAGQCEKLKGPWFSESTTQQELKHQYVISIILPKLQNTAPCKILWRKLTLSSPKSAQEQNKQVLIDTVFRNNGTGWEYTD